MGIRPAGWPRSAETSMLWVFVWAGMYAAYSLFMRWFVALKLPRLSDTGKKQFTTEDDIAKFAAQCIVAITSHIFLGPAAFYVAVMYHYHSPEASLSCLMGSTPDLIWMDVLTCRIGEVFTGNMVYQTLFWFLGWERDMVALLHHVGFLIAGALVLTVVVYGKIAMAAVAMEMSSPFLNLYLLTRTFDGDGWMLVSNLAMVSFAFVFVIIRLCYYTYVILEFHYLYWFRYELLPHWTPPVLTCSIMTVFTLGWLLQLFWGKTVVLKSMNVLRKLEVPKSKRSGGK